MVVTRVIALMNVLIQALIGLTTIKLASLYLDQEQMKTWVLMVSALPYILFFDFGVYPTLIREVTFLKSNNNYSINKLRSVISSFKIFSLWVLILLQMLFLFLMFFLDNSFYVVIFYLCCLSMRVFSNSLLAMVVALISIKYDNLIRIVSNLTFSVSLYVYLESGLYLWSLPFACVTQVFLIVLFCILSLKLKSDINLLYDWYFDLNFFKGIFIHLKNWTLTSLPSLFVFSATIYVISINLSNENIIQYSILHQVSFGVLTVALIPSKISSPYWSFLFSNGDLTLLRDSISKILREVTVLSVMGLSTLILLGDIITSYINFIMIDVPLICYFLFSILIFLESIQVCLTATCVSAGNTNFIKVTSCAAILSLGFTYIGSMYIGLEGAILGMILSQSLSCNYFNIKRAVGMFSIKKTYIKKCILSGASIITLVSLIRYGSTIMQTSELTLYKFSVITIIILLSGAIHFQLLGSNNNNGGK